VPEDRNGLRNSVVQGVKAVKSREVISRGSLLVRGHDDGLSRLAGLARASSIFSYMHMHATNNIENGCARYESRAGRFDGGSEDLKPMKGES
jgi:hypothetical protein